MDPYLTFLMEHWMLSTAFVVIVILILFNEWQHRSFGVAGANPSQLVDLLNHSGAVVIDVRPALRFEQGHILGALNVPKEDLTNRLTSLNKYKNKPLILVCTAGGESPKLGRLLKQNGFNQLYYLVGGMDLWQSQSMPIVKK